MKFRIRGVKNLELKREIQKALRFFARELGLLEYEDVTVNIKAKKKIDALGYCSIKYYDDDDTICSILMEVQAEQDRDEMISTIAHEMVHVKQYVTGELTEDLCMWKGHEIDSDAVDYEEHPWEIEAEKIGGELDEKWNNIRKNINERQIVLG